MYFSIWKIGEFHLWILCFRYSHISKLSLAIFIANPCRTSISIDFLIRYADLQRFVLNFFFVTIIKKNVKITQQNNLLEPPFFIDTPSIPNSYMICELMLKLVFKIMEVNGIQ